MSNNGKGNRVRVRKQKRKDQHEIKYAKIKNNDGNYINPNNRNNRKNSSMNNNPSFYKNKDNYFNLRRRSKT